MHECLGGAYCRCAVFIDFNLPCTPAPQAVNGIVDEAAAKGIRLA